MSAAVGPNNSGSVEVQDANANQPPSMSRFEKITHCKKEWPKEFLLRNLFNLTVVIGGIAAGSLALIAASFEILKFFAIGAAILASSNIILLGAAAIIIPAVIIIILVIDYHTGYFTGDVADKMIMLKEKESEVKVEVAPAK